jgi:hypothetical protein
VIHEDGRPSKMSSEERTSRQSSLYLFPGTFLEDVPDYNPLQDVTARMDDLTLCPVEQSTIKKSNASNFCAERYPQIFS